MKTGLMKTGFMKTLRKWYNVIYPKVMENLYIKCSPPYIEKKPYLFMEQNKTYLAMESSMGQFGYGIILMACHDYQDFLHQINN